MRGDASYWLSTVFQELLLSALTCCCIDEAGDCFTLFSIKLTLCISDRIHHQIIMFEVGILTTHSIIYAKSALWMCFNFQGSPAMVSLVYLLFHSLCKPYRVHCNQIPFLLVAVVISCMFFHHCLTSDYKYNTLLVEGEVRNADSLQN